MADGWDDWGDDDDNQSHSSEKSEGWDWPAEEGGTAAEVAKPTTTRTTRRPVAAESTNSTENVEAEARTARAVNEMTDKFFLELRRYQEDLADPCVREEVNQVREAVTAKPYSGYKQQY